MNASVEMPAEWSQFKTRYWSGEYRSRIFSDMVLADLSRRESPTVLDIGCGSGFDGDPRLQTELAAHAAHYIGIEPDPVIAVAPFVREVHRCTLEECNVVSNSVDVAFAVMVLEHIRSGEQFFERVWQVLKPGGVFWGFTMDARHYFCAASQMLERLHLKNGYLTLLRKNGAMSYENYPTYYRLNTPRQLNGRAERFAKCESVTLKKIGDVDHYVPRLLRKATHLVDHAIYALGAPGSILVTRLVK